jgi:Tol biopolymer transport system component
MKLKIYSYGQGSGASRAGSKWLRRTAIAAAMATALVFAPMSRAWQASAQQPSWDITQITNSTGGVFSGQSSINTAGTHIVFSSNADLTGGNADHNSEIFLYNTENNNARQITYTTGNLSNSQPSISADGTRIVFASIVQITSIDIRAEISLYDTQTASFTRITNSGGLFRSELPSISGDGTRIVFVSTADLTGNNPNHEYAVFLYDTDTGNVTQISTNPRNSDAYFVGPPSITADGTRIAFSSIADVTSSNTDHNLEIFLYNTQTGTFTQVTDTSGFARNRSPSISADGTHIAFSSSADLTGDNPDESFQIFLYHTDTANITQITSFSDSFSGIPSINSNGTRITFTSDGDLMGLNPNRSSQVFFYDTETGSLTQITNMGVTVLPFPYGSSGSSISGDGTRIAFSSLVDLTGGNADLSSEIFLAICGLQSGNNQTRVYPLAAYTNLLYYDAFNGWLDPASGNLVFSDTYGKLNRSAGLGLNTNVTGNVTVRNLGDGNQQVVVNVRTTDAICWGYNAEYEPAFGYDPFEVLEGIGTAALGHESLRITFEPQPLGSIRYPWPIQFVIGNLTCEGPLRAGSGYPEGTPGFAQTTQTGIYNTGVPGGCPQEHTADCFPAETIQFKPRGN